MHEKDDQKNSYNTHHWGYAQPPPPRSRQICCPRSNNIPQATVKKIIIMKNNKSNIAEYRCTTNKSYNMCGKKQTCMCVKSDKRRNMAHLLSSNDCPVSYLPTGIAK